MNRKAILILSAILIPVILLIVFFIYKARVARGMEVEILPPPKVLIGVPFDLKVGVSNKAPNTLANVRLALKLPSGVAFVGSPESKDAESRDLSVLTGGSATQQTFKLIALSGENTFKKISASTAFTAGAFNSRFERGADKNITVSGHALALDISAPQKVLNGQPFDTEISFKNIADGDLSDMKLRVDYPPNFTLSGSTLPPDIGNNVWILGSLRRGEEFKFKITGSVIGPEGAFFDARANVEVVLGGQLYSINSNVATLSIAPAPISLKINLNNDNEFIAGLGSDLRYTVNYANNTDVGLRDVIVRAQLVGAMYDLPTISTNGSFRSSDNTIVWTAASVPSLINLAPGQTGSVQFSVRTKNAYPIKKATDKNFTLKILASVDSPTVPHFVAEGKTINFANIENKVKGQVDLDARAYFRDSASGISNKGQMPLRLNEPTNFTIHWVIANYSTDISNVDVRAFLGGNVRMTGIVKSNAVSVPTYNERTQEVVWQLPKIEATAGIIGKPVEAIFQVEAVPSIQDLNRDMLLIRDSELKATDDFTGLELADRDGGITTQLPDDKTVGGQSVVLQHQQVLQLQQQQQQARQSLLQSIQNLSKAQQDQQLKELEDDQLSQQKQLESLLERQLRRLRDITKDIAPPPPVPIDGGAIVIDEACADEARDKRDAELAAANDNHDDDLEQALEKRRNLLIAAALVGDPHLRHILIVAAIKGYEEDEKEIEEDWQQGQSNAQRQYQQDLAECNSAAAAE